MALVGWKCWIGAARAVLLALPLAALGSSSGQAGELGDWCQVQVPPKAEADRSDFYQGDGAAAVRRLVTYVGGEGGTFGDEFVAAEPQAPHCQISSGDGSFAVSKAPTMVLATSDSLKTDAVPFGGAVSADPAKVWRGLSGKRSCLFGFSGPLVDADTYGAAFLRNLGATDVPLSEAFAAAARQVSYDNVPVSLCWGQDLTEAQTRLLTSRQFAAQAPAGGAAFYAAESPRLLEGAFALPNASGAPLARRLLTASRPLMHAALARQLLAGSLPADTGTGALHVYRNAGGTVTYDESSAMLSWRATPQSLPATSQPRSDGALVKQAEAWLQKLALVRRGELKPTYVVDVATGTAGLRQSLGSVVVLHQRLGRLLALGGRGSVEVRFDNAGKIVGLSAALFDADLPRVGDWLPVLEVDLKLAQATALRRLARRRPQAQLAVTGVRVGYRFTAPKSATADGEAASSRLVAEVTMVVEQQHLVRRYVQLVAL